MKAPRYLGRDSMVAQSGTRERSFQDRQLMSPSVMQRLVSGEKKNTLRRIRARLKSSCDYYSFVKNCIKLVHWTHATLLWPIRAKVLSSQPIKCKIDRHPGLFRLLLPAAAGGYKFLRVCHRIHMFSRAWHQSHVFASNSYRFTIHFMTVLDLWLLMVQV